MKRLGSILLLILLTIVGFSQQKYQKIGTNLPITGIIQTKKMNNNVDYSVLVNEYNFSKNQVIYEPVNRTKMTSSGLLKENNLNSSGFKAFGMVSVSNNAKNLSLSKVDPWKLQIADYLKNELK
jgi:hypothetical protein